jgi:hypothetical protein
VIDHQDFMMGHHMIRPYKLHRRLRESSFQSPELPILLVKFFIISISFALAASLLSKSRDKISFKGGRAITPCVTETLNHFLNPQLSSNARTN